MVYCITTYNVIKSSVKENECDDEYLDFVDKTFAEFESYLKEDENIRDVKLYTIYEIKAILDLRKISINLLYYKPIHLRISANSSFVIYLNDLIRLFSILETIIILGHLSIYSFLLGSSKKD